MPHIISMAIVRHILKNLRSDQHMHELSIVQGLVSNIEHQKKKYNFDKVLSVDIMCGKYNCLSEETIQFCYDLVTENSYMHGAHIKLLRLTKDCVCMHCRNEFNVVEAGHAVRSAKRKSVILAPCIYEFSVTRS